MSSFKAINDDVFWSRQESFAGQKRTEMQLQADMAGQENREEHWTQVLKTTYELYKESAITEVETLDNESIRAVHYLSSTNIHQRLLNHPQSNKRSIKQLQDSYRQLWSLLVDDLLLRPNIDESLVHLLFDLGLPLLSLFPKDLQLYERLSQVFFKCAYYEAAILLCIKGLRELDPFNRTLQLFFRRALLNAGYYDEYRRYAGNNRDASDVIPIPNEDPTLSMATLSLEQTTWNCLLGQLSDFISSVEVRQRRGEATFLWSTLIQLKINSEKNHMNNNNGEGSSPIDSSIPPSSQAASVKGDDSDVGDETLEEAESKGVTIEGERKRRSSHRNLRKKSVKRTLIQKPSTSNGDLNIDLLGFLEKYNLLNERTLEYIKSWPERLRPLVVNLAPSLDCWLKEQQMEANNLFYHVIDKVCTEIPKEVYLNSPEWAKFARAIVQHDGLSLLTDEQLLEFSNEPNEDILSPIKQECFKRNLDLKERPSSPTTSDIVMIDLVQFYNEVNPVNAELLITKYLDLNLISSSPAQLGEHFNLLVSLLACLTSTPGLSTYLTQCLGSIQKNQFVYRLMVRLVNLINPTRNVQEERTLMELLGMFITSILNKIVPNPPKKKTANDNNLEVIRDLLSGVLTKVHSRNFQMALLQCMYSFPKLIVLPEFPFLTLDVISSETIENESHIQLLLDILEFLWKQTDDHSSSDNSDLSSPSKDINEMIWDVTKVLQILDFMSASPLLSTTIIGARNTTVIDQLVRLNLNILKTFYRRPCHELFPLESVTFPKFYQIHHLDTRRHLLLRQIISLRVQIYEANFAFKKRSNISWLKQFQRDLKFLLVTSESEDQLPLWYAKLSLVHREIARNLLNSLLSEFETNNDNNGDDGAVERIENKIRRNLKKALMTSMTLCKVDQVDLARQIQVECLFAMTLVCPIIIGYDDERPNVFRVNALHYLLRLYNKCRLGSECQFMMALALLEDHRSTEQGLYLLNSLMTSMKAMSESTYTLFQNLFFKCSAINWSDLFPILQKPKSLTLLIIPPELNSPLVVNSSSNSEDEDCLSQTKKLPSFLMGNAWWTIWMGYQLVKRFIEVCPWSDVNSLIIMLNRLRNLHNQMWHSMDKLIPYCCHKLIQLMMKNHSIAELDADLNANVVKEIANNKQIIRVRAMLDEYKAWSIAKKASKKSNNHSSSEEGDGDDDANVDVVNDTFTSEVVVAEMVD